MRRTKNDVIFNLARLVSFIHCPLSSIRLGGRVMKILVGHNRPKTFWSWTLGIKNSLLMEIVLSWAHIITRSTRVKICGFPAGSRIEDQVATNLSWESIVSPRGASRLLTDVENLMLRSGELMSTTNETFWAGNLKETPLCGVAPQQHKMNTPALVLQHHKKSFPFPYTHKKKLLQETANCLRTNGMKGRNGERKID